jgi:antitoxin (DNA-binding transcriptional repressor) of toxin-antitoxin stability system
MPICHSGKHEIGATMSTVTIEEAQAKLPELIEQLGAGEELVITRNEQPVARLLAEPSPKHESRKAGSAKGILTVVAEDDEHLEHFKEYLP